MKHKKKTGNAKVEGPDVQQLNEALRQGVYRLHEKIQRLEEQNSHLTKENELLQSDFDTTKLQNKKLSRKVEELVGTVKECKTQLKVSTDAAGHEYDMWENDSTGVDYSPDYCYEEVLDENIGDKETKSGDNSGKNFVFQDEVKGENIMVGNEVAAISSGGPMEFMDPLKDNSMLNKDAKLPTGGSGSGSDEPVKVEVDGALIGNESVNVQTNVQNVYLSGSGPTKKEVEQNEEKLKYKAATQEELAEYLQENREKAAKEGNLEDLFKHENLDGLSDDLKMKAIARMARDPGTLLHAEGFLSFCEKLASTEITDTKALGPHLDHISRINLTNMNPDFKVLATFFSCFESKLFDWIIIRNSTLKSSDLLSLAESLGACKVACIDMSYCSYEFGAFDWFEFLLSHCKNVVLRGVTSSNIFQQSEGQLTRKFSGDDAMKISECIFHVSSKATTFGVDLSECDLTNLDVVSKFAVFMREVSSLSLERCSVNIETMKMILSKINQLDWFDLRMVGLRNEGLALLVPLLGKIKVLLLAGILIDENGLDSIVDFLEDPNQPAMEVLDISGNIISQENIVRLLRAVGRVELMIFSHDQHVQNLVAEDSDTIIRKVSGGVPYDVHDDTLTTPITHYIAHTQQADEQTISDYVRTITSTVFAVKPQKYLCGTCKAHIAFSHDLLQPPCVKFSKDRSVFGFFENEDFVAVRYVYGLKESKTVSGIHHCVAINCPLEKAIAKKVKCATCSSSVGLHYEKEGLELWILFEDHPGSMVIANMNKTFRAMKNIFS